MKTLSLTALTAFAALALAGCPQKEDTTTSVPDATAARTAPALSAAPSASAKSGSGW